MIQRDWRKEWIGHGSQFTHKALQGRAKNNSVVLKSPASLLYIPLVSLIIQKIEPSFSGFLSRWLGSLWWYPSSFYNLEVSRLCHSKNLTPKDTDSSAAPLGLFSHSSHTSGVQRTLFWVPHCCYPLQIPLPLRAALSVGCWQPTVAPFWELPYISASQSVVPGPAASASPGNWLKMQNFRSTPTHWVRNLGPGPAVCVSDSQSSLTTTALGWMETQLRNVQDDTYLPLGAVCSQWLPESGRTKGCYPLNFEKGRLCDAIQSLELHTGAGWGWNRTECTSWPNFFTAFFCTLIPYRDVMSWIAFSWKKKKDVDV